MLNIEIKEGERVLKTIRFPEKIEEITLWQGITYQHIFNEKENWFKESNSIDFETMNELKKARYVYGVIELLSIFTDAEFKDLLDIELETELKLWDGTLLESFLGLFVHLHKLVGNYKPKERGSFRFGKKTFQVPKKTFSVLTGKNHNPRLTSGEAIQVLQFNHYYSQKEKNIKSDYYKILGIMAALCRQKGVDLPLDEKELNEYLENQIEFFKEVPFAIGLDLWFFFAVTSANYKTTLFSDLLSRGRPQS
jgi:hypothetical protein